MTVGTLNDSAWRFPAPPEPLVSSPTSSPPPNPTAPRPSAPSAARRHGAHLLRPATGEPSPFLIADRNNVVLGVGARVMVSGGAGQGRIGWICQINPHEGTALVADSPTCDLFRFDWKWAARLRGVEFVKAPDDRPAPAIDTGPLSGQAAGDYIATARALEREPLRSPPATETKRCLNCDNENETCPGSRPRLLQRRDIYGHVFEVTPEQDARLNEVAAQMDAAEPAGPSCPICRTEVGLSEFNANGGFCEACFSDGRRSLPESLTQARADSIDANGGAA